MRLDVEIAQFAFELRERVPAAFVKTANQHASHAISDAIGLIHRGACGAVRTPEIVPIHAASFKFRLLGRSA
jgi:hypothetical protein